MPIISEHYTLNNGVQIPKLGFGTWQVPNGNDTYNAVSTALKLGYRHIDTALAYGNEQSVGKAVRDSGIERAEIFVTTKLPAEIKTADGARDAFATSLGNLGFDYVDLYLIHAPWPWTEMGADYAEANIEIWKVFEALNASGKALAIGVSNFNISDLESLIAATNVVPQVNQIRWFVGNTMPDTTAWAKEHGILVEGFSPLATGELLRHETLVEIAEHYDVTTAQLALRYVVQNGVLPLPKSTTPARIKQNAELDFVISDSDVATLDSLTISTTMGPK